jgi:peptidoglycan/LPS O-acetylase OafA/YrhL
MQGAQQAERLRPVDLRLTAAAAAAFRFGALDAWRGVAALAVALYRLQADGWFYAVPFVRNAYLFVDFFFVLSGFVIAYAYLGRVKDARSTAVFAIRRFGRLWPLHIAMLLAFVALEASHWLRGETAFQGAKAPWTIAPELALLHGLGFTGLTDWNSPSWSISTEFWTYLVFAALALSFRRQMAVACFAVVAFSMTALVALSPTGMDVTFDYGMLRCLAGFFSGVATFLAWRAIHERVTLAPGTATALECAMLLIIVAFVSAAGTGPLSFAAPFVFAPAVLLFAFEAGALSRAMLARPLQALGEWSYAIYMTAYFIALFFNLKLVPRLEGVPMDAVALAYLACVVAASWLSFRLIETPTRRFFNAIAARLQAAAGRGAR